MASDFELACDEFVSELDALAEMAAGGTGGPSSRALSPRARVAAGNGAVLLLAAVFEEHIRQQLRSAFREKARIATDISEFPKKIAAIVWKRSLESLARTPFDEIESDNRNTSSAVSATLEFCLKKDFKADVAKFLSHNENNMRSGELNRLFNQIGIQSIISETSKQNSVVSFLGCDNPGQANAILESKFDDFFRRRNSVAHAIQIGSSSGPSELLQDIELFRTFAKALFITLANLLLEKRSSTGKSGENIKPQVTGKRATRAKKV